ncbi:MAG: ABC transporter ATP-binding protein, partial [Vicinamibacterales bacterium]
MPTRSEPVRFDHVSKLYRLRENSTLKEYASRLLLRNEGTQPFRALDDVSFTVNRGETLGIIGRNGGGKSTVLKLIAGVTQPTAGMISTSGRIAPLLELGTGFHPDLTGRENVYLNGCILGLKNRRIAEL